MTEHHRIERVYEGEGVRRKITPVCSCGWVGNGYEAHNDWQHTLVYAQVKAHKKEMHRAKKR